MAWGYKRYSVSLPESLKTNALFELPRGTDLIRVQIFKQIQMKKGPNTGREKSDIRFRWEADTTCQISVECSSQ